jgi:hypothetical protein
VEPDNSAYVFNDPYPMKGGRQCPICDKCGSKKFKILGKQEGLIVLECRSCAWIIILN